MKIPDFIVHYNRSEPFRSISEVSQENLRLVLNQLDESKSWGLNRFLDPEYMPKRLKVEQILRDGFIAKGGMPELNHPIYLFLGRNRQFEEHKRNIGYSINLENVPSHLVSFTYGDSMFSMCDTYRKKLGSEVQIRLCAQVYRLAELNELFSAIQESPQKLHIECQLWMRPAANMITIIN